jgi:hypothetical protein
LIGAPSAQLADRRLVRPFHLAIVSGYIAGTKRLEEFLPTWLERRLGEPLRRRIPSPPNRAPEPKGCAIHQPPPAV